MIEDIILIDKDQSEDGTGENFLKVFNYKNRFLGYVKENKVVYDTRWYRLRPIFHTTKLKYIKIIESNNRES